MGQGPALGDLQGEVRAAVVLQLHADTTSADCSSEAVKQSPPFLSAADYNFHSTNIIPSPRRTLHPGVESQDIIDQTTIIWSCTWSEIVAFTI